MKYVFLGSIDFKVLLVIILYFNASLLKAKIDLAASSLFGNPRINQLTSFEASSFEKFDPRESIFRAFLPIRTLAPNYIRNEDIELVGGFLIPTERCIERIIKDYFFELVGNDHL
ncbi:hypothetical protein FJ364_04835, partial [Candidatus Dependentiae bacterium]|nr:hypothetical protein [Candidatus Dependentiae bacterium]